MRLSYLVLVILTISLGVVTGDIFAQESTSLKHQLESGIVLEDILCRDDRILVMRSNGSPACVSERNAERMGWEIIEINISKSTPVVTDTKNDLLAKHSSLIELSNEDEIELYLDVSKGQIEISDIFNDYHRYYGGMSIEPSPEREPSPEPEPMSEPESSWKGSVVLDSDLLGEPRLNTSSSDYSTTNIQVQNVDEPDYVKNDGEHIFIANDHTITIIDATPPKDASISDQFSIVWNSDKKQFTDDGIHDIFLNDDKLIIFLKAQDTLETRIMIMDIASKDSAEIYTHLTVTGDYQSARMIDEFIYLVTSHPLKFSPGVIIPSITHQGEIFDEPSIERKEKSKIFAFPANTLEEYTYKTITSFDISGNNVNSESYLMGEGNTMYVSPKSIYITYEDTTNQTIDYLDWEFIDIVFPYLEVSDQLKIRELLLENPQSTSQKQEKWSEILDALIESLDDLDRIQLQKIQKELKIEQTDKILQTVIQKIDINNGQFEYVGTAKIDGTVLNQFSMDEYNDHFRIATTSWDPRVGKSNNVLVFDIKNSGLNLVGFLDKIAVNEDIYSARFVGDTLYLVTFRQVDPFFVIDLSKGQPEILGELKLPGFSNYLHPFGDNHVIGIGRDGGVKIALFDVSDFENPKLSAQVFIGDRSTFTEAEENHKSILIDYEKQLLAIPITDHNNKSDFEQNQPWYGFYVYKATDLGFTPKGTVEVKNEENYNGRTLYIGDTLYSISPEMVSINELASLKEIKIINLD